VEERASVQRQERRATDDPSCALLCLIYLIVLPVPLLIPRRLAFLSIPPMSSSSSQLFLPPGTPFPVTVVNIQPKASDLIQRGSPLLTYSFSSQTSSPGGHPQVLFGIWDCPVEGTIERWCVKERDVITSDEKAVLYISEPCKHGVQVGGLCALCGKDMTECVYDLVAYIYASQYSSTIGPTTQAILMRHEPRFR